jgi:hypothetical protein
MSVRITIVGKDRQIDWRKIRHYAPPEAKSGTTYRAGTPDSNTRWCSRRHLAMIRPIHDRSN